MLNFHKILIFINFTWNWATEFLGNSVVMYYTWTELCLQSRVKKGGMIILWLVLHSVINAGSRSAAQIQQLLYLFAKIMCSSVLGLPDTFLMAYNCAEFSALNCLNSFHTVNIRHFARLDLIVYTCKAINNWWAKPFFQIDHIFFLFIFFFLK